jgi:CMP-N,N'-diacetyllegionaminic acid synthase
MVVGLICARKGSKGIPGKNKKELGGIPLIMHTLQHASHCLVFDRIIISTDDHEIATLCRAFETQMRPDELATDTASKWDVFRHVAKVNNLSPDDILVDLDTGCPFREGRDIADCTTKLQLVANWDNTPYFDVVMTAYESERNPYFNMVEGTGWVQVVGDMEYHHEINRRQDAPEVWSLSPSVCAIRVDALAKYSHWSTARLGIVTIPRARALDLDTPDDWEYAEYLMQKGTK